MVAITSIVAHLTPFEKGGGDHHIALRAPFACTFMMLRNPEALTRLIEEYGRMLRLDGYTAHSRGQRLNSLIADMLLFWGINAKADFRNYGEIDVAFELEGRHYILEAKWESTRTDSGAIAKLQKRLRQRLGGTLGVFVSMAGYSDEALRDLKDGEQLEVLCLTRDHLEAMLSGFIPPAELISQLVRQASRRGEGYIEIADVFDPPYRSDMNPAFEHPREIERLVIEAIPGFDAYTIISDLPFGQTGVAEVEPERLLVTTSEGIFLVDLRRERTESWLSIPNCSRNPLVHPDGFVYVVRKSGVARISGDGIRFVAGGLVGNVCLSASSDKSVWAFSNGLPHHPPTGIPPSAVRIDGDLGSQSSYIVDYPPAAAHVAACIDGDRFLVCGNSIAIVSPDHKDELLSPRENNLVNPGGLTKLDRDHFLIACDDVELWIVDISCRQFSRIAKLQLSGSVYELATSAAGGGYLSCYYPNRLRQTRGIVARWQYSVMA